MVQTAFLANVSHELRTPLTLMLGPLESIIIPAVANNPELKSPVDILHRSTLRLHKMVNELLEFSRMIVGRTQVFTYG